MDEARLLEDVACDRAVHDPEHTSGSLASRKRNANGSDSTHWRIGRLGSTSSIKSAAISTIRRAPQLGQIARPLLLNATSFSAWQLSHFTRREAVLEPPALQVRLELRLHMSRERPSGSLPRGEKRRVVLLDEPIKERLLGPVLRVARRVDERRRTPRRAWLPGMPSRPCDRRCRSCPA